MNSCRISSIPLGGVQHRPDLGSVPSTGSCRLSVKPLQGSRFSLRRWRAGRVVDDVVGGAGESVQGMDGRSAPGGRKRVARK